MSESIASWFEERQRDAGLVAREVDEPLGDGWIVVPSSNVPVRREDGLYFEIVNSGIGEAHCEIPAWMQPLLREKVTNDFEGVEVSGIVVLVRRLVDDQYEYLVRSKAEAGNNDVPGNVLLASSVQASFSNALDHPGKIPLWDQLDLDLSKIGSDNTMSATFQRKDGGRFLDKINLFVHKDFSAMAELKLPSTHIWTTREAIRELQLKGLANEHLNEILGVFT